MSAHVVRARPTVMSRIGWAAAGVVLGVFAIISLVMRHDNAGAHFGPKDQVGTAVLGIIIAASCWLLTRPRLEADESTVRIRSFAGNYRTVPWSMIIGVEFPSNVRFARLMLPGDESFAVYAVQRLDGERAVQTMRELRALFAATHPKDNDL